MTVSDLKHQFLLDNTAMTNGSIEDLEWLYYATSGRSGLVPFLFYSIADHKRAYFEAQTGLVGKTLQYLERAYWGSQGVPSGSYSDMANYFYDFSPYRQPNLELALDAGNIGSVLTDASPVAQWNDLSGKGRHVTQAVGTKQPLFRNANKNLLSYSAANCETVLPWTNGNGSTLTSDPAQKYQGVNSIKVVHATAPNGQVEIQTNITGLTVGTQYTVSGYIYIPTQATNPYYGLSMSGIGYGNFTFVQNAWVRSTYTFVATAVTHIINMCAGNVQTLGDYFYMDAVQIEAGPVATPWVAPVTLPNNLPTVQFDGISSYLSGVLAGQATSTVYVVCIVDAQKSLSEAVFNLKMGGTDLQRVLVNGPANYRKDIVDDLAAFVVTNVPVDATKYVVISSRISPNKTNVNGGVDIVGGGGAMTVPMSDITLGAREVVPDGFLAGSISAFLVFSTSHDDATRKRIEKWLGAKYGISVA